MIGHAVGIDVAVFILVTAAVVFALVFLYRRRQLSVRSRRATSVATEQTQTKRQVAAVPVRRATQGETLVLVISTRGSGRWTVPKGWPMRGRSDADAAAQEAYEEAGVRGTVVTEPIGTFEYTKRRNVDERLLVTVYRLDVTDRVRRWRERGQRKLRWLPASTAADCVAWNGLAEIIRSLETTHAV